MIIKSIFLIIFRWQVIIFVLLSIGLYLFLEGQSEALEEFKDFVVPKFEEGIERIKTCNRYPLHKQGREWLDCMGILYSDFDS